MTNRWRWILKLSLVLCTATGHYCWMEMTWSIRAKKHENVRTGKFILRALKIIGFYCSVLEHYIATSHGGAIHVHQYWAGGNNPACSAIIVNYGQTTTDRRNTIMLKVFVLNLFYFYKIVSSDVVCLIWPVNVYFDFHSLESNRATSKTPVVLNPSLDVFQSRSLNNFFTVCHYHAHTIHDKQFKRHNHSILSLKATLHFIQSST